MQIESKLLVKAEDVVPTTPKFRVRGIFNPAAIRLKSKKILLLARVAETPFHGEKYFIAPRFAGKVKTKIVMEKILRKEGEFKENYFLFDSEIARLPTISHFRKVLLDESGMNVEKISKKPDFMGLENDGDFGVEDPRLTCFKKEGFCAMTYVSVSMYTGVSTSLAITRDLKNWSREGIIFRQQNKDVVIFPEKINGYYVALHRPEGTMIFDKPRIWLSYSKDLVFWGRDKAIMSPRKGSWDGLRIGNGSVPLKIDDGWLEFYHGVSLSDQNNPDSQKIYCAGAIVFDHKDPSKVLARSPAKKPLLSPEQDYEKFGFVSHVVFPTAALFDSDKKHVLVFGGGGDSSIFVKRLDLKDVLNSLEWS